MNSAFGISFDVKFHVKPPILNFYIKFAQKGCFRSKTEIVKQKAEFQHRVQHAQIILEAKFHFEKAIVNFGQNYSKEVEKTLLITLVFQNFPSCHKILFQKFTHLDSLKMIFENNVKIRVTHFNVSVDVNAA